MANYESPRWRVLPETEEIILLVKIYLKYFCGKKEKNISYTILMGILLNFENTGYKIFIER